MGQQMKMKKIVLALITIGLMAISMVAFAHHGTAISYDQDQQITLQGTVTEFVWRNPHAQLWINVAEGQYKGQSFAIEMNSPAVMLRWGWTRSSMKPGDEITVKVNPSKTGRPVGECLNCVVEIKGKPTLKPTENAGNQ